MNITSIPSDNDRKGIFRIAGCDNPNRSLDLVLLHGLGGDAFTTWMSDADRIETFWPLWLAEDRPEVGIWTLGYEAELSGWKSQSMPIADRTTQILDLLYNEGLGRRPVVFVAHSMGGIVSKQLLLKAEHSVRSHWTLLADSAKGIAFIATPHSGSNLANFAKFASLVLRTNEHVDELRAHESHLRDLHAWFRGFYDRKGLVCRTWCERREVRANISFLGIQIPKGFIVVDATSAEPNLPGEEAIPLDEDHISICKPQSRSSQIYVGLLRWLDESEKPSITTPVGSVPTKPTASESRPIAIWRKKLGYLETELAKASGAPQRFELEEGIAECKERIRALGGEA